ncbi:MAG: PD-(D/E)XK nuclease family protein [Gammaproteobacteria bacterium]
MDENEPHPRPAEMPVIHFALVADAGAARRLRREVATGGARTGWLAGTWRELVDLAMRAYVIPPETDDWSERFQQALRDIPHAFWSASLAVAPEETAATVFDALVSILSSTDPAQLAAWGDFSSLPPRAARHLNDLSALAKALDGCWPPELAAIQSLLGVDAVDALHLIRVEVLDGQPELSRWQMALLAKLNRDADGTIPDLDSKVIAGAVQPLVDAPSAGSRPDTALCHLQRALFQKTSSRVRLDSSLQRLAVRDFLQEAEVAAGMIQERLGADPSLTPAEIGVLLPDSFEYTVAVDDAFRLAGLLTSGLAADWWRRDLGMEWLFHFLYCRQKPAPAMALAVCLSSPLMPWSREIGAGLAQQVMDGDFRLDPARVHGRPAQRMMSLIRDGDRDPQSLRDVLREIPELLNRDERVSAHRERLESGLQALDALLASAVELDWPALRHAIRPRVIRSDVPADLNQEGVTIWTESQEPWRPVRHLLVLGFARGAYPSRAGADAVFSESDLEAIRTGLGLPVDTPARQVARRRGLFRRQLGAVSDSVNFLVPRRDASGGSQGPSESLVFMGQLFEGIGEAEALLCELDTADGQARARGIALAPPAAPQPPRPLAAEDMEFGQDLVMLRKDSSGNVRPESPSSLELLMVSPLAWLLRRLGAEPTLWAPEGADAALLGTIAHRVLELTFRAGQAIPSETEIASALEGQVDEVLRTLAPTMRGVQWQMEMRRFREALLTAAVQWRDILLRLDAEILGNESWLQGSWAGISIHGQTDQILGLTGGRLLVVDYKRSKSTSRALRMEKSYDCQANLYRLMLETGGLKDAGDEALNERLRQARDIGIVYYLLNDQVALSDTDLPEAGASPAWRVLGPDVSSQAMEAIRVRLTEVQGGRLLLNRSGDRQWLDKEAGIAPYALDNSPLIDLFSITDAEAAGS